MQRAVTRDDVVAFVALQQAGAVDIVAARAARQGAGAVQRIVVVAAVDLVVAERVGDQIGAVAAEDGVVAITAVEAVIVEVRVTVQIAVGIVAVAAGRAVGAVQHVVAGAAQQRIVAAAADQGVVAEATGNDIIAVITEGNVIAAASIDVVEAVIAEDGVVAVDIGVGERVIARDRIVGGRAGDELTGDVRRQVIFLAIVEDQDFDMGQGIRAFGRTGTVVGDRRHTGRRRDRVVGRSAGVIDCVEARTAVDRVVAVKAGIADDGVGAIAARQAVAAAQARYLVVARAAGQGFRTRRASDRIVAVTAIAVTGRDRQAVIAQPAVERARADDRIVAVIAEQLVRTVGVVDIVLVGAAVGGVVAGTAIDGVVLGAAIEGVIAFVAAERIVPRRAVQRVGDRRADQVIVAGGTVLQAALDAEIDRAGRHATMAVRHRVGEDGRAAIAVVRREGDDAGIERNGTMGRALDRREGQAVAIGIRVIGQQVGGVERRRLAGDQSIGAVRHRDRRVVDRIDGDIDRTGRRRRAVREDVGEVGRAVIVGVRGKGDVIAVKHRCPVGGTRDARNGQGVAVGVMVVRQQRRQRDVDSRVFVGGRRIAACHRRIVREVDRCRRRSGAAVAVRHSIGKGRQAAITGRGRKDNIAADDLDGAMGHALDGGDRQAVAVDVTVIAQQVADGDKLVGIGHADIGAVITCHRRVIDRGDIDINRALRRRVAIRQSVGNGCGAVEVRVRHELNMVGDDRRRAAAAACDASDRQRIAVGVVIVRHQAGQGNVDGRVFGGRGAVRAGDRRRVDDVGAV